MPKPKFKYRSDTKGSIVRHGEFLSMTLLVQGLGLDQEFNWQCSCGEEGDTWRSLHSSGHPRAVTALGWTAHVSQGHPEVGL